MKRLLIALSLLVSTSANAQVISSLTNAGMVQDVLQYAVPTSGATVNMTGGSSALVLNHSVLLATLTVVLPPNPMDGQRAIITSGAAITVLTIDGNGITVKGGIASLALNGYARYIYSATANAWFRTG